MYGIIATVLIMALIYPATYRASVEEVEFQVSKTDIKIVEENSLYLVYTDNGTFKVADTYVFFRFNSADTYGKIMPGQTYKAKVAGWRVPLFSMYKNIIEIE